MTATTAKRLQKSFGTTEPPHAVKTLSAGPLSVELRGGNLGAIHFKGVEVLRGIAYLVRDANWGTIPAKLSGLKISKSRSGQKITYLAKARSGTSNLAMSATIEVTGNTLAFSMRATPDTDFQTNRTGFVILHPINGVAGRPLTVTHVDGTVTRSRFPKYISPGQPFFDIRALSHKPAPGLTAEVRTEGPKFEMEDQRNWGDASFKTYVCSLLDPWPYVLKAGETFSQRVTLTVAGELKQPTPAAKQRGDTPHKRVRLPTFNLAISPDDVEETLRQVTMIERLRPSGLTCLWDHRASATLASTYAALATATGLPVTLEIVLPAKAPAEQELAAVKKTLAHAGLTPGTIVITHSHDLKSFQPTDKRPWGPSDEDMAKAARRHFPNASLGGGMLSYFTELNRKPPNAHLFDFITHSLCPVVHDAGDAAVMQTIGTLPHIFASARAMIGKTPYHLGPTTIAARMNPYGAGLVANPRNRRVCLAPNDPRQFGEFAVTWNLALIAEATRAKISQVTLSSLCGPRGLIDGKGKPTPLFHVFADLFQHAGQKAGIHRQGCHLSLALDDRNYTSYIANLSGKAITHAHQNRTLRLPAYGFKRMRGSL